MITNALGSELCCLVGACGVMGDDDDDDDDCVGDGGGGCGNQPL
jgi:hypothetical protein